MAALRGAHRGRIVALVLCSCQRERELSRLFALHIQRQRCLWESLGHTRFCPPFVDFASMSVVAWTRTFYGVAHVQVGKCGKGCVIVPTPALRNIFCKPLAYATHWPNGSNVGSRTPLWQMEFQLFSIELWRGLASVAARGGLTRFSLPMHVYGYKRRLSCLILLVDACPRGATAGSSQQLRRRRPEACNSSCQH